MRQHIDILRDGAPFLAGDIEFRTLGVVVIERQPVRLGKGHQGIADTAYGTFHFNKAEGKPELIDIVRYRAECVNPPADVDSVAWLESGMKGAKCN